MHETGIQPPARLVGAIAALAFVFGTTVLVVEADSDESANHGNGHNGFPAAGQRR